MNNTNILKPALIGGMALGILSALPFISICNCLCCAWVIGGGILAAYLYVKDSPVQVTMGRGALVGLATGAIGAVVSTLFSIPLQKLLSNGSTNAMFEQVQELMAKNPDMPQEFVQRMEALLSRSDFMAMATVLMLLLNIVIFSLFAMLGGAIGIAIFEKRRPGDPLQPDVILPPPTPPTDTQPPNYF